MKTPQGERIANYVMLGFFIGLAILFSWRYFPHPTFGIGSTMKVGTIDMYPNSSFTPGSTNPAVTQSTIAQTICNKNWKTETVRDTQTSPAQKQAVYPEYQITKPQNNSGQNQVCEIDHFISLELGGSDKLDNLWPQCGLANVSLNQRYFKEKDGVENYLHAEVCAGTITLDQAQQEITTDWYAVYKSMNSGKLGAMFDINDPDDN